MTRRRTRRSPTATNQRSPQPTERPARERIRDVFVARPFEGLASEPDWIALRELVPAATAPLRLAPSLVDTYGERDVTLATVLPMAAPGVAKADGRIFLGLQRGTQSGDVSRDLALALLLALAAEPGTSVSVPPLPGPGPRLQDVLADGQLDVTMHDGFEFWLAGDAADATAKASLERANASMFPTVKLAAAPAAYWCQFPEKAHVRWVLPGEEEAALAALSRLAARRELTLGAATRFAGMFRAHRLLVPVWDLPRSAPAEQWDAPLAAFAQRYAEARATGAGLDSAERRARQGLLGRQLTLR